MGNLDLRILHFRRFHGRWEFWWLRGLQVVGERDIPARVVSCTFVVLAGFNGGGGGSFAMFACMQYDVHRSARYIDVAYGADPKAPRQSCLPKNRGQCVIALHDILRCFSHSGKSREKCCAASLSGPCANLKRSCFYASSATYPLHACAPCTSGLAGAGSDGSAAAAWSGGMCPNDALAAFWLVEPRELKRSWRLGMSAKSNVFLKVISARRALKTH